MPIVVPRTLTLVGVVAPIALVVRVMEVDVFFVPFALHVLCVGPLVLLSEVPASVVPACVTSTTVVPILALVVYSPIVVFVFAILLTRLSELARRQTSVLETPLVVEANILGKLIPHILVVHVPLVYSLVWTLAQVMVLSTLDTLKYCFALRRIFAFFG